MMPLDQICLPEHLDIFNHPYVYCNIRATRRATHFNLEFFSSIALNSKQMRSMKQRKELRVFSEYLMFSSLERSHLYFNAT